jgi:hypothetical protein
MASFSLVPGSKAETVQSGVTCLLAAGGAVVMGLLGPLAILIVGIIAIVAGAVLLVTSSDKTNGIILIVVGIAALLLRFLIPHIAYWVLVIVAVIFGVRFVLGLLSK